MLYQSKCILCTNWLIPFSLDPYFLFISFGCVCHWHLFTWECQGDFVSPSLLGKIKQINESNQNNLLCLNLKLWRSKALEMQGTPQVGSMWQKYRDKKKAQKFSDKMAYINMGIYNHTSFILYICYTMHKLQRQSKYTCNFTSILWKKLNMWSIDAI